MREAFVNITDIPTHIITWGKWIEESFSKKEVVICITGNPGLPGFYTEFMAKVHEKIGQDTPVWVIGHAGHDEPPNTSIRKVPSLTGNEYRYGLRAQIKHKLEFIRTYVPDDVKIHLIGHSIGAWILLEILKEPDIRAKVQHCYLLFPTIERMAETYNGILIQKVVQPLWSIARYLYIVFSCLPIFLQVWFLSIYFFIMSIPRHFLGTALKYARLSITEQALFLVGQELEQVREVDLDTIRENRNLLKLYYGSSDGWAPSKYCTQLKDKVPDLDAEIDRFKIDHAFVLRSSVQMGVMVGEWILQYKRK